MGNSQKKRENRPFEECARVPNRGLCVLGGGSE